MDGRLGYGIGESVVRGLGVKFQAEDDSMVEKVVS